METHCPNKRLLMNTVSLKSRCFSVANLCLALCDSTDRSTTGLPVPQYLSEFAQVRVRWIGDAVQPSHPLLPFSPSAFKLSQHQGLLQGVCSSHQVAKVLEFQHHPSNEYSGLISFRMDKQDLPAVQGTLKSLLQHHNSKALILQCSAFFIVQLSYQYMTTGKTIALTICTFVGRMMSLLFNTII